MTRQWTLKLLGGLLVLAVMAGVLAPDAAQAARKRRIDRIMENTPALRDIRLPDIQRRTLDNGLVVYLVENHDLPLVQIRALIRAGAIYEPAGKVGLAGFTGEVMRTGGTEAHPGDALDVFLEDLGARIEVNIDDASGLAAMNCLAEHLDQVLPLYAEVLREPVFPQEKLDLIKTQAKSAISRRNDDAGQIARREINKLIFGADSPYARAQEYDHVNAIERGDLAEFHEYFFHPNNMILVAGGDFDADDLYGRLEAAFGDWPPVETFYPPDPILEETPASVNYVYKEDVNQSKVRMGHLGIRHDDEYLFPLLVLNEILGGGFGSRLVDEVRTKRELAYSVGAYMLTGDHHRAPFYVGCDTKSESTVKAIRLILDEIRRVTVEPVTEAELHRAKAGLKNAFVFRFDSPFDIAWTQAETEFWSKDPEYLDNYLRNIDAVTAADILAAAQARIRPDELAILVVGRAEDFDEPLDALGAVNEIDITIPEPSFAEEVIPAATEASLAEGERLMADCCRAYGGQRKLAGIRALETRGDLTVQETPVGPLTLGIVNRALGDDRLRIDTTSPFGSMVQVVNGDEGWAKNPMGKQAMTAEMIADAWQGERRSVLHLLRDREAWRAQYVGRHELDGAPRDVVYLLDEAGEWLKLYLEPESHLIRAMEYKDKGETGPVRNLTTFDEIRRVDGVGIAHALRIHHDGKLFATYSLSEVRINPDLAPDLFTEPE
ncbi:MAG: insulinase family protein [Candidatus Krumholzibacteriota bacterium]|nr:insulinase family protein [Candidatus Krumholzibacteriota bacterium]